MAPRLYSRYTFCTAQQDAQGRLFLSSRIPFRFINLPDNRTHVVGLGDSLHSLAARYFVELPRPAGFFWVIADFQPEPIHDPTIALAPGTVIIIPSTRTLVERIFSEERRNEEPPG